MTQSNKTQTPEEKESSGFLRRVFGRVGHEKNAAVNHSGTNSKLELSDIQGFILRGYRMPMVRHFLLTVGAPAGRVTTTV